MKLLIILLLLTITCFAKTIRIAHLDTGYLTKTNEFKRCGLDEEFDATQTSIEDGWLHGQNTIHIIDNTLKLKTKNYCIVPIKIIGKAIKTEAELDEDFLRGYYYVLTHDFDIVNMSFAGTRPVPGEKELLKRILDKGTIIVASAGNNNIQLNRSCKVLPACADKRIIVVGSLDESLNPSKFSNWGKRLDVWEIGENVCAGGFCESGTSQATAITTGKIVLKLLEKK